MSKLLAWQSAEPIITDLNGLYAWLGIANLSSSPQYVCSNEHQWNLYLSPFLYFLGYVGDTDIELTRSLDQLAMQYSSPDLGL